MQVPVPHRRGSRRRLRHRRLHSHRRRRGSRRRFRIRHRCRDSPQRRAAVATRAAATTATTPRRRAITNRRIFIAFSSSLGCRLLQLGNSGVRVTRPRVERWSPGCESVGDGAPSEVVEGASFRFGSVGPMIWSASTMRRRSSATARLVNSSEDTAAATVRERRPRHDSPLNQCPGSPREPAATVPATLLAVTRLLGEPLPRHGLRPIVRAQNAQEVRAASPRVVGFGGRFVRTCGTTRSLSRL